MTSAGLGTAVFWVNQTMVTIENLLFTLGGILMGQFLTWLLTLFD